MKLASVPSWLRALLAPNWFVTTTPIDPARFVTKAIMKNRANITMMAGVKFCCLVEVVAMVLPD